MKPNKLITAKDIAKLCGVSQATVSYIINNKEGKKISDETREKVLKTIKELQYIPNSCARGMRTQKAMSIGVVSGRDVMNISFNRILRGMKQYGDERGYSLTLLNNEEFPEAQIQEYIQYVQGNKIDGIMFVFYEMSEELLERLDQASISYLVISEKGLSSSNTQFITPFLEVITECIEFCKVNELKNIGFVKREGWKRHYKYNLFKEQLNFIYEEATIKPILFKGKHEEARDYIQAVIEEENFDIVFTPNQWSALITQSAILKISFSIPQVVKHICLGEGNVFQSIYPTITALDIPLEDMGSYAMQVMLAKFNHQIIKDEEFKYKILYRMSTD